MGVWLVKGDDEALVSAAVAELLRQLVGDGDRSVMVDEFSGEDYQLAVAINAASTPAFLSDRRVVLAREIGRFSAEQSTPLVAYLDEPMDSTDLVLTNSAGRLSKAFNDAMKRSGGQVVDAGAPSRARERQGWYDQQFAAAGLQLDAGAKSAVIAALGEDVGRVTVICEVLASSFLPGRRLTKDDVEPFLGEGGSVPPWELTDAIDRGDTTGALERLERMTGAGGRHPLQVLAVLQAHYGRMLRLSGSTADDEASAAAALGLKGSTFPARKALDQMRRLGPDGVRRAVVLLSAADLDVRGATDWPPELVMEVAVARLSKLSPGGARRR